MGPGNRHTQVRCEQDETGRCDVGRQALTCIEIGDPLAHGFRNAPRLDDPP